MIGGNSSTLQLNSWLKGISPAHQLLLIPKRWFV